MFLCLSYVHKNKKEIQWVFKKKWTELWSNKMAQNRSSSFGQICLQLTLWDALLWIIQIYLIDGMQSK